MARLREQYQDRITFQYDVADLEVLRANPERGYAMESPEDCGVSDPELAPLADLIAPIIIEADGAIVPIQYNFSRAYQIGNLDADCLESQLAAWKKDSYPEFLALCREVYCGLLNGAPDQLPFANWYGAILQQSHSRAALAASVS